MLGERGAGVHDGRGGGTDADDARRDTAGERRVPPRDDPGQLRVGDDRGRTDVVRRQPGERSRTPRRRGQARHSGAGIRRTVHHQVAHQVHQTALTSTSKRGRLRQLAGPPCDIPLAHAIRLLLLFIQLLLGETASSHTFFSEAGRIQNYLFLSLIINIVHIMAFCTTVR